MEISQLKEIILDQKQEYVPSNIVYRDSFALADKFTTNNLVNIITGLRRCGKSVFLHYLRGLMPEKDYFINFEDDRLALFSLDDFQKLLEAFIEIYGTQKHFYFDEI